MPDPPGEGAWHRPAELPGIPTLRHWASSPLVTLATTMSLAPRANRTIEGTQVEAARRWKAGMRHAGVPVTT